MMDEYNDLSGVRWSLLREILRSPRAYEYASVTEHADTPAMLLGRAAHCAVLEPTLFERRYAVTGNASTKAGKAALEEARAAGVERLTSAQWEAVQGMAAAVTAHPAAQRELCEMRAEVRAQWTRDGRACKARLDGLSRRVVELKTTRCETLREIAADCARRHYHAQCAWYHDGAIAAGLLPADAPLPVLIVVTSAPPHDVVVMEMSDDTLHVGRLLVTEAIETLTACEMRGQWPGLAPEALSWDLPSWAMGGAHE